MLHANIIITGSSVNNTALDVSQAPDHITTITNKLRLTNSADAVERCSLPAAVDIYLRRSHNGVSNLFLLLPLNNGTFYNPMSVQSCVAAIHNNMCHHTCPEKKGMNINYLGTPYRNFSPLES